MAFPFNRERMNILSAIMPASIARGLLTAEEEAAIWREFFDIDCLCDNDSLYLISGCVKQNREESMLI